MIDQILKSTEISVEMIIFVHSYIGSYDSLTIFTVSVSFGRGNVNDSSHTGSTVFILVLVTNCFFLLTWTSQNGSLNPDQQNYFSIDNNCKALE